MVADRWIPPKIMFAVLTERGLVTKSAYLVRMEGKAWAYAHEQELHMLPHDAVAFPLDPLRIVEETNTETGQTYFAYQGEPPELP